MRVRARDWFNYFSHWASPPEHPDVEVLSLRRSAGQLKLLAIVGISEPVFPNPRERV